MSIGDFHHFSYAFGHVLPFVTNRKFKDEPMNESSRSPEDQQAFGRIAKKLDINLEANDLAGSEATFTNIEDRCQQDWKGRDATSHRGSRDQTDQAARSTPALAS
jgi:hypothetical protein